MSCLCKSKYISQRAAARYEVVWPFLWNLFSLAIWESNLNPRRDHYCIDVCPQLHCKYVCCVQMCKCANVQMCKCVCTNMCCVQMCKYVELQMRVCANVQRCRCLNVQKYDLSSGTFLKWTPTLNIHLLSTSLNFKYPSSFNFLQLSISFFFELPSTLNILL